MMDRSKSAPRDQGGAEDVHRDCKGHDRPLAGLATPGAAFLALLGRGLWPVGIYPPGITTKSRTTTGKEPFGPNWGLERWTVDRWKDLIRVHPKAGCGVCLGPGRGPGGKWLIDVEGDDPDAEASRAKL